jgi:hypothetical protein
MRDCCGAVRIMADVQSLEGRWGEWCLHDRAAVMKAAPKGQQGRQNDRNDNSAHFGPPRLTLY